MKSDGCFQRSGNYYFFQARTRVPLETGGERYCARVFRVVFELAQ
jgi:hypothetical protein